MANKTLKITSISDLKKATEGEVVELPPFAEGHPFVAKMKRPSVLSLVRDGRIPNNLLVEANKLFVSGPGKVVNDRVMDPKVLGELFGLMEVICKESFVEPSYDEIKAAGVELTDEQLMFVFAYSQRGVNTLSSFRVERRDVEVLGNVQGA